jgi:hypothetical protein
MQDYFWKDFYMHGKFDVQHICTSMLAKFYSYKKRVLHPRTHLNIASRFQLLFSTITTFEHCF